MSFKRDICCFDIRSNFLVSISFLINVGKEMSLPGFPKGEIGIAFYGSDVYCGSAHTGLTQGHCRFHILGEWVLVRGSSFTFLNLHHFSFLKGKNHFPLSIELKERICSWRSKNSH